MGDDPGTLSKKQLTLLAQYFDERVTSSSGYKVACIRVFCPPYWNRCPTGKSGRNVKRAEKTVTDVSSLGYTD
jgi:hypothetical protein